MTTPGIDRYLDRYGEAIAQAIRPHLSQSLGQTYQSVLVIPLFDEAPHCLDTILPEAIHNTLIIGVINAAIDADPAAIQRTQTCLEQFQSQSPHPFTVLHQRSGNTLLIIDCCTPPRQLPRKQGVGLARKIGGDIALTCIAQNIVQTPWIHCTDGDVQLPPDYFATCDLESDVAVAIYPFCHHPLHDDILRYEISLRYYVTALARAGSPYAFQTIGSLLKINANHYAMVRGFPKRQAAEDFYMLNKLAKTGKVMCFQQPKIVLSSRISRRVPFGTGAAMARLSQAEPLLLYHPQIFRELQSWLGLSQTLWDGLHALEDQSHLHAWWQQQDLSDSLWITLRHLKGDQAILQGFRQCRDFSHFHYFLMVWFDAFRTLKFIHYQREHYWPSLPIPEAMALFWPSPPSSHPANIIPIQKTVIPLNQEHPSLDFLNILTKLESEESQLTPERGPTLSLNS